MRFKGYTARIFNGLGDRKHKNVTSAGSSVLRHGTAISQRKRTSKLLGGILLRWPSK